MEHYTIDAYNRYLQETFTIDTYRTLATDTYNRHLHYACTLDTYT